MVGNLRKKKWNVQKNQVKKKWSWTKAKEKNDEEKKKKRSRSAIWALLCKVSGIDVIWKVKLCSTSL